MTITQSARREPATTMSSGLPEPLPIILARLDGYYSGDNWDWGRFYQPRRERRNFASRYHLVYPALGYFLLLQQRPELSPTLRPKLDAIYLALLDPRVWSYWHTELGETTWPLAERNLTYAGRLATFVGFYIAAFGSPPSQQININGRFITYTELSQRLWQQMAESPSGGVTCYHHQAMVMCKAHLLINNLLHDRLFGTRFAAANEAWLQTIDQRLLTRQGDGPLFYFGTEPGSTEPDHRTVSLGIDAWSLFLMSGVVPDRVRTWFEQWRGNISTENGKAWIAASWEETEYEVTSVPLATAWAFALARELGEKALANGLRASLQRAALKEGFVLDPLLSGLILAAETLQPGGFRRLVSGER